MTHSHSSGQCLIDKLENVRMDNFDVIDANGNYSYYNELVKGGINELKTVFKEIKNNYGIEMCFLDTLYIISGYDVETGQSNGRLWNEQFEFRYKRTFDVENFVIKNDTIIVQKTNVESLTNKQYPILEDFDTLIKLIERKDTIELFRIQSENSTFSGWNYSISTIEKENGRYKIFEFSLDDIWIQNK